MQLIRILERSKRLFYFARVQHLNTRAIIVYDPSLPPALQLDACLVLPLGPFLSSSFQMLACLCFLTSFRSYFPLASCTFAVPYTRLRGASRLLSFRGFLPPSNSFFRCNPPLRLYLSAELTPVRVGCRHTRP